MIERSETQTLLPRRYLKFLLGAHREGDFRKIETKIMPTPGATKRVKVRKRKLISPNPVLLSVSQACL